MTQATLSNLLSLYSDMYKETYGVRPYVSTLTSVESAQKAIDDLEPFHTEAVNREREEAIKAISAMEKTINAAISAGAADRVTAMRWLVDSYMDFCDSEYDLDEYFYQHGLLTDDAMPIRKEFRNAVFPGVEDL